MNIFRYTLSLLILLLVSQLSAQKTVSLLPGELWWGGQTARALDMPFSDGYEADLKENLKGQVQTLLLSNKGRYIWREEPFSFEVDKLDITLSGEEGYVIGQEGESLASAFEYAAEFFLVYSNQAPSSDLALPQYNLAVELGGQINQANILAFANRIKEQGLPNGILQLDGSWQSDHGSFAFDASKFPDAKKMINELHQLVPHMLS